jgi:hypothetical protein
MKLRNGPARTLHVRVAARPRTALLPIEPLADRSGALRRQSTDGRNGAERQALCDFDHSKSDCRRKDLVYYFRSREEARALEAFETLMFTRVVHIDNDLFAIATARGS